jgi:hypothetical protein
MITRPAARQSLAGAARACGAAGRDSRAVCHEEIREIRVP